MVGDGLWRQVAVPSRLYSPPTEHKPLAGKRISVKDNFKVAGIKTTQNNRAWLSLYGPERETASVIQDLISLGAVIVGKTKMCAFASSEEATDQWIDFHAPFNPRADGYQSPSGSTTGGGASLATYDWLDFSIGTDSRLICSNPRRGSRGRKLTSCNSNGKHSLASRMEWAVWLADFLGSNQAGRRVPSLQVSQPRVIENGPQKLTSPESWTPWGCYRAI